MELAIETHDLRKTLGKRAVIRDHTHTDYLAVDAPGATSPVTTLIDLLEERFRVVSILTVLVLYRLVQQPRVEPHGIRSSGRLSRSALSVPSGLLSCLAHVPGGASETMPPDRRPPAGEQACASRP